MAYEYEAVSPVVVLEIVVPRVPNIVVLEAMLERRGSASAGQQRAESGQGDLAVHGRERAALRCEARELLADHITLRLIGDHVAVRRRISRYGRINVKAIDRGVGVSGPGLAA